MKELDEIFYARQDFETPEAGEMERAMEATYALPQEEQDEAAHLNRSSKGALQRRWNPPTWQERAQVARELQADPAAESAFWFYSLGGKDITDPGARALKESAEEMPSLGRVMGAAPEPSRGLTPYTSFCIIGAP